MSDEQNVRVGRGVLRDQTFDKRHETRLNIVKGFAAFRAGIEQAAFQPVAPRFFVQFPACHVALTFEHAAVIFAQRVGDLVIQPFECANNLRCFNRPLQGAAV